MSGITEIDAMKAVDDALSKIDDAVTKDRILNWAWDKYSSKPVPEDEGEEQGSQRSKGSKKQSHEKRVKKNTKTNKKAKAGLSILKDLNLKPKNKKSFDVFITEKQPVSNLDKATVSIYYLKNTLGISKVSLNHVYTCFKGIKWRVPANLANTIAQAGTKGLVDNSDTENIKLATHGENLVDHDLPKSKKS